MNCFVDTSGVLAALDADETHHDAALATWKKLVTEQHAMLTTSYVLLECFALIQNRLGITALRTFNDDMLPLIAVEWIDAASHEVAAASLFAAGRRKLSLVDCASFVIMRRHGIKTAFTLDKHFAQEGFVCLPK